MYLVRSEVLTRFGLMVWAIRFWNLSLENVPKTKMSQTEVARMKSPLVPLATLIGREIRSEKVEKPYLKYGQAALAKKGEDYFLIKPDCHRIHANPSTSFSVFAVWYILSLFSIVLPLDLFWTKAEEKEKKIRMVKCEKVTSTTLFIVIFC